MDTSELLVGEGLVGVPEACKSSGVGRSFLYQLMDRGELKYVKLGKRRLIPRVELRRLLAESIISGQPSAGRPQRRIPACLDGSPLTLRAGWGQPQRRIADETCC
jgi:excisionase family DNA binding protein